LWAELIGSKGLQRSAERSIMKFKVVLESAEEGGFTVYVPSLPGCISQGETRKEALKNIKEAIELYLEPVEDDVEIGTEKEIVEVSL
jgi:predicted RNase H-like HicB family nuclease